MSKRSYRQNCSLAHGADLLGERWTLLIFRELLIQPCSFGQLESYLQGIGTNLLARRLKDLESAGLLEKQEPEKKRTPYQLSENGRSAQPLILEMIRWGYRFGVSDPAYRHLDHWDLLAMQAFFQAGRCSRRIVTQFASDDLTAWVEVSPGGFKSGMGRRDDANLTVANTIAGFQRELQAGKYAGNSVAKAFVDCFALPLR